MSQSNVLPFEPPRHGDSNKVGFALLFGGVRLTGRFPAGFELIGSTLLAHVCAQLRIEGMLFLDYLQRQPTRYEHIERIKQYLGLRSFGADDQAMVADFVREQVRAGTPPDDHVRQAPYILDGLLYHTTHLQPTEHYTDTHGYTDLIFGATQFAVAKDIIPISCGFRESTK